MKLKSTSIMTIFAILMIISVGGYRINQNMNGSDIESIQVHHMENEASLSDREFSNAKEIRYSGPYLEAKSPDSL